VQLFVCADDEFYCLWGAKGGSCDYSSQFNILSILRPISCATSQASSAISLQDLPLFMCVCGGGGGVKVHELPHLQDCAMFSRTECTLALKSGKLIWSPIDLAKQVIFIGA
jgi:hypothetical protein